MIELSKRLSKVAEYVEDSRLLVDVGSDHAYLPIYLVEQGKVEKAIAGEVVQGPYDHALSEVKKRDLQNNIDVRLGDGLDVIDEQESVDYITICGMGGVLIRDILDKNLSKINEGTQLVLQPNVGEPALREFLADNNFIIEHETIVSENSKYYEIIHAKKSSYKTSLSDEEVCFGPELLKQRDSNFHEKWKIEINKLQMIVSQMENSKTDQTSKIKQFEDKIHFIKEHLNG